MKHRLQQWWPAEPHGHPWANSFDREVERLLVRSPEQEDFYQRVVNNEPNPLRNGHIDAEAALWTINRAVPLAWEASVREEDGHSPFVPLNMDASAFLESPVDVVDRVLEWMTDVLDVDILDGDFGVEGTGNFVLEILAATYRV